MRTNSKTISQMRIYEALAELCMKEPGKYFTRATIEGVVPYSRSHIFTRLHQLKNIGLLETQEIRFNRFHRATILYRVAPYMLPEHSGRYHPSGHPKITHQ